MPQFVVSGVHAGRSLCLLFDKGQPVSVADVKTRVQELEGVPAAEQRLLLDSSDLPDDHAWPSLSPESKAGDDGLVLLSLRLRLSGGKGGFGSLLRGGPAGVTVKKTTNFDACRDLSGRRLRHVNQEKKLAEWRQGEAERKLAEKGEKFTKAQASTVKRTFDDRKFSEQTEKMRTSISAALEDGLKNEGSLKVETQKLKRAAEESTSVVAPSKKTRLWTPLLDDLEEEEEDQKQDEPKNPTKSTQPDLPPSTAAPSTAATKTTTTTTTTITTTTSNVSTSTTCTDTTTSSSVPNTTATTTTTAAASVSSNTVGNGGEKKEKAELLDLTQFGSAEELEKLGADTLKLELQKRGMLCGGKVQERAARLFAVKGVPLEKIPKHLKPNTKAKK